MAKTKPRVRRRSAMPDGSFLRDALRQNEKELATKIYDSVAANLRGGRGTVIRSVSFKANAGIPGSRFEHVHIEASADVGVGQTPHQVLRDLKEFVAHQLKVATTEVVTRTSDESFQSMLRNVRVHQD